jgi:hypothetical protein
MYINNVGTRSMERILNVSNVLLLNWKEYGKEFRINNEQSKMIINNQKENGRVKIEVLEMDESC